jgi:hypothetical protein
MKYRKLRIAWSVGWGLACVLLIVLWVRSYWRVDAAYVAHSHCVVATLGTLYIDAGVSAPKASRGTIMDRRRFAGLCGNMIRRSLCRNSEQGSQSGDLCWSSPHAPRFPGCLVATPFAHF